MEKRTLHRGDIFLNRWAGWMTLFIYFRTSGRYCYGVSITNVEKKHIIKNAQYYKESIVYDTEHFPLVGKININDMWIQAVLAGIPDKSFINEYKENGNKKYDTTKNT